jgi:hypothetical protein
MTAHLPGPRVHLRLDGIPQSPADVAMILCTSLQFTAQMFPQFADLVDGALATGDPAMDELLAGLTPSALVALSGAITAGVAADAMGEQQPVRPDNRPLHENGVTPVCGAEAPDGSGYVCTAATDHTGPHMAYLDMIGERTQSPKVGHSWPQDGE